MTPLDSIPGDDLPLRIGDPPAPSGALLRLCLPLPAAHEDFQSELGGAGQATGAADGPGPLVDAVRTQVWNEWGLRCGRRTDAVVCTVYYKCRME